MAILYSGGMWTVALVFGVSCGYVWALNGPRMAYKALLLLSILVVAAALLLPETHMFRVRIVEGLHWWKWALAIAIPVFGYGMLVRWIKTKADARHDS
ncbi:MAG: hypothetical protein GQ535_04510 [Rhodobacteraceae bacterium]|nr:hypothetical protein [Paracoccaceae bacterium]